MFTNLLKVPPLLPLWCGVICATSSSISWAAFPTFDYYADSIAVMTFDNPPPVVTVNGIPIFPNISTSLPRAILVPFDRGNNGDIDELIVIAPNISLTDILTFEIEVPEAHPQPTPSGTTTTGTTSIAGYDKFHQNNDIGDNAGSGGGEDGCTTNNNSNNTAQAVTILINDCNNNNS